ncbi:MAG: KH domain-containing protein [Lentisphaeria bacterium]
MVLNFFKRAFKTEREEAAVPTKAASKTVGGGEADPKGFVEFVVKQLVDSPEQVTVEMKDANGQFLVEVKCAKADMGKVIGKGGKTIDSIRALAASAGRRIDQNVRVDVLD